MQLAVIASLLLSIWHSILFFRQEVGISVILFAIPIIFTLLYVLEKMDKIKNKKSYILSIPILILSSTYLFFDNKLFNVLNIFVICALFATMIIWAISEKFKFTLFFSKIFNIIIGPIEFFGKSISIIKEVFKTKKEKNTKIEIAKRIIKAILIAIPVILVILFLLISSDDEFAKIFSGFAEYIVKIFTSWEFVFLILRVVVIAILFIYFVSFIYNLTNEKSSYNVIEKVSKQKKIKIDVFTVNTVLTILNIIYAIFSVVQIINLGNLKELELYSASARQGFFQLMIVSLINFIFIIISSINELEEKGISKKYRKIMNVLMLIFTIIILIVSFQKMAQYVGKYGYTYLRIFVFFVLATETILIIPTAIYIIKEKINLFYTYLAIIITMYIIMNFINIDKLIANKNINLYFETGKIDFEYLEDIDSASAVIEIKRLYNNISDDEKLNKDVNNYLYNIKKELKDKKYSWQSFNFSKNKLRKELENLDVQYKYNKDKYKYDDYNEENSI